MALRIPPLSNYCGLLFFLAMSSACVHDSLKSKVDSNLSAVVEAYYTAYNQRDISAQLDLLDINFVHQNNSGVIRNGKEAYKKSTTSLNEEVNEKVINISYFVDVLKSIVVAESRVQGGYMKSSKGSIPQASGQKYDLPLAEIFQISNGKILKLSTYYNELEWRNQISQ